MGANAFDMGGKNTGDRVAFSSSVPILVKAAQHHVIAVIQQNWF